MALPPNIYNEQGELDVPCLCYDIQYNNKGIGWSLCKKKKHLKPKRELTALFLRVYIAYSTTLFGEELFMLIS